MTDISDTLAPKSDQQNYDDYQMGPRTVTIVGAKVLKGDQQPVHLELAEYPGRPYKPNKSMRRVIAEFWGPDSSAYVGRALKLFGNPKVTYGGKAVGGIEIAAMSHIDGPKTMPLTARQGQKKDFTVQPLAAAPVQQVASTPGITAEQWSVLLDAATVAGIENTGAYAAETLGRQLSGWQEITPVEYETIMARINTPAS